MGTVAATVSCPWCGAATVPGGRGTRRLVLAGKTRGHLCPSCAGESWALEADAHDAARDYAHTAW